MNDYSDYIKVEASNGTTKAKIKAKLILTYDLTEAAANKAVSEALGKAKAPNFIDGYYGWLEEGHKTEIEVEDYVLGRDGYPETSLNTKKHLSHYRRIAQLTNNVHASK